MPHDLHHVQKTKMDSIGEMGTEITRGWEKWKKGWSKDEGLPNTTRRK
jgi:hypothetical protein